jgi:hypothetical protein
MQNSSPNVWKKAPQTLPCIPEEQSRRHARLSFSQTRVRCRSFRTVSQIEFSSVRQPGIQPHEFARRFQLNVSGHRELSADLPSGRI